MPSPPPTDEELELKQHVTKALTNQGVLGKIKRACPAQAQLRAAVFHVMHEHEVQDDDTTRRKLQKFRDDGDLALAIVMDFLAFFELKHSLAVLKAEANAESGSAQHEVTLQLTMLHKRLGVSDNGNTQRPPLLIQMLQQKLESSFGSYKEGLSGGDGAFLISRDERPTNDTPQDWEKLKLATTRSSEAKYVGDKVAESDAKNAFLSAKLNSERHPSSAIYVTTSSSITTKPADGRGNDADHSEGDDDEKNAIVKNSEKSTANMESENEQDDEEEDEEIASGSELNESIAEEQSASLNYSQDYESASKDFDSEDADERATRGGAAGTSTAGARAGAICEEKDEGDHGGSDGDKDTTKFKFAPTGAASAAKDEQESDDEAALTTIPPPVSTKLSSLPLVAALNSSMNREPLQDDDEFDAELEAARLSSLDAKLKAMEAEDETGTLQQLKATLQMELQHDDDARSRTGGKLLATAAASDKDDEEHDGYGSDFEEEEVISEVSDDEVGSVSDLLSDNDESQVFSTLKQPPAVTATEASGEAHALHEDKAVADENALNSYDYIEEVERD